MKSFKSTLTARLRDKDSAFSLAEGLIASVVILIILIATAAGLSTSFNASISSENRNKAMELVNNTIAIARQAPFKSVGMANPTTAQQSGCRSFSSTFDGENRVVTLAADAYPGLVYCQKKKFSSAGIEFTIETNTTWVSNFDSSSEAVTFSNTGYQPKRVNVRVTWAESADSDGEAVVSSVFGSWIKTPNIAECVPPGLNASSTSAAGCSSYVSSVPPPLPGTTESPRPPSSSARILVSVGALDYQYLAWRQSSGTGYSPTVQFKVVGCGTTDYVLSEASSFGTAYNGTYLMKDSDGSLSCTGTAPIQIFSVDANGNESATPLSITPTQWAALPATQGYNS